jgi:hypothetical protein
MDVDQFMKATKSTRPSTPRYEEDQDPNVYSSPSLV